MAIIFDEGLLKRRQAQALTPVDLCKIALCAAIAQEMPEVTVYSSAQAQGAIVPAVFVRFGKMQARGLLGKVEHLSLEAQFRYLPRVAADDGENETAMQALLDALGSAFAEGAELRCLERTAERTAEGAQAKCEISLELRRADAAQQAEGMMRMLEERVEV